MEKKTMAGLIAIVAVVAVLISVGAVYKEEDFSTAELTHENVINAVKDSLGKDLHVDIYGLEEGGECVRITRPCKGSWNYKEMLESFARDGVDALEILFSNPQVNQVTLVQKGLTSKRGSLPKEGVLTDEVQVTVSRETADRINWDNLAQIVLTDYTKFFDVVDSYRIEGPNKDLIYDLLGKTRKSYDRLQKDLQNDLLQIIYDEYIAN